MFRIIVMASVAALMAAPAAAEQTAGTEASAAKKDKKICRREVSTGSIMAKPICRTRAEWDTLAARGRDDADRVRDQDRQRSSIQGSR